MTSSRMFIHPVPVRVWHWINAAGILLLVVTGVQIRFAEQVQLLSLQKAITLHNYTGFVVLAAYLFWLAYYFGTGQIKTYLPDLRTLHIHTIRQLRYYGYGYFRGEPNPFSMTPENKFNPMQQMGYCSLMLFMMPAQIISGLFLWQVKMFGDYITLLGGVKIVDTIHVLLFFCFAAFLLIHCYLASLGHTPLAHFKAMCTGYEEPHGAEDGPGPAVAKGVAAPVNSPAGAMNVLSVAAAHKPAAGKT